MTLDGSVLYRIRVRGVVPDSYRERLGGMRIVAETGGIATLEGRLPDQAALAGVLDTLFDLHLEILEVSTVAPLATATVPGIQ